MSEMTLDVAQIAFETIPDRIRAGHLLSIATQYWRDGMIGDDTYAQKVGLVRRWLVDDRLGLPEGENASGRDSDKARSPSAPVVELIFRPQAWVNDYAIAVDPESPDVWTVSLALFLERFPTEEDWSSFHQDRDDLRFEGSAPKWIRDWSGPFEVDLADCATDPWTAEKDPLLGDPASNERDWPNEAAICHSNGAEIRVPAFPEDVSYVRVVRADGTQIAHWSIDEIAEDPAETIGAIAGAVIGGSTERQHRSIATKLGAAIPPHGSSWRAASEVPVLGEKGGE